MFTDDREPEDRLWEAVTSRRHFLALGGLLAASPLVSRMERIAPAAKPLDLLVLGGTNFVGPAIVSAALRRGHTVTLFNRGKTNPEMFAQQERIRGDRTPQSPDLRGLEGTRRWDAVVDVWPSDPHMVAATAQLLRDRAERYLFISSIVAYKDLVKPGAREDDALFDDLTNAAAWYEYDKAQSERVLESVWGDRRVVLRSHIIVGDRDPSDSFRMWAVRIQRGGEVLAPGDGSDPVQFTDVKDLGAFAVSLLERGGRGAYNVAGPTRGATTFRGFLEGLNQVLGRKARLTWVDQSFLEAQGLRPFSDLAMWVPVKTARKPGFMRVDTSKALADGLSFRPLRATSLDELEWFRKQMPANYDFGGAGKGFSRAREQEILAAWHAHGRGGAG